MSLANLAGLVFQGPSYLESQEHQALGWQQISLGDYLLTT